MRATLRLKLALVYTILFTVMAILLVSGITYLTARSTTDWTEPRSRAEQALDLPAGTLLRNRPPTDPDILPIIPPRHATLRQVAAGVQAQTRSQLLTTLIAFSVGLLFLMAVISLLVGWFVARRILRPLRRITQRAQSLSETNLHERIALEGPRDELRELADTFDQMLARLDVAFMGQRLFVANASHELRTPLTRIRTKLDVTLTDPDPTKEDLDRMAATIRDAVERSSRLIDSLLTLPAPEGSSGKSKCLSIDWRVRSSPRSMPRHGSDESASPRRCPLPRSWVTPCSWNT
jgi:signal transduction histidine kinase